MSAKMDADYFIRKFEAIPDELWCENKFRIGKKRCALGHLGSREHHESKGAEALKELMHSKGIYVGLVNDGDHPKYQQPTPRARMLAALRDLKEAGK